MYRMEMTLNKITFQINPALIVEFIGQEKKIQKYQTESNAKQRLNI